MLASYNFSKFVRASLPHKSSSRFLSLATGTDETTVEVIEETEGISGEQQPEEPKYAPKIYMLRLSQVIANSGLASRREAERIIHEKRVNVAGKLCNLPSMLIPPEQYPLIEIDGVQLRNTYSAVPKIWAIIKQPREIMSTADPQKSRSLLIDRMRNSLMPQVYAQYGEQMKPIYRLDYVVEGLALYTNSGELAKLIHQQGLPITYRLRLNGLLTESKLQGLRKGLHSQNKSYARMEVEIEHQSNTMTWLKVVTKETQFNQISEAFKSMFLNITRGICVGYGPYNLKDLFPVVDVNTKGDSVSNTKPAVLNAFTEVKLVPALHAKYLKLQNAKHHNNSSKNDDKGSKKKDKKSTATTSNTTVVRKVSPIALNH